MNKKWIGGLLAAVMLGSVCGVTACKNAGGLTEEIEPGTVITDGETKTQLYEALTDAFDGLTFTASASIARGAGEEAVTERVSFEGTARGGERLSADVCGTLEEEGEERSKSYLLCFVRGSDTYTATGEWKGEESYAALKEELKAEEPLILTKYDLGAGKAFFSPTAARLARNLAALADGAIVKTEGGYDLTFDTLTLLGKALGGVKDLVKTVVGTAEMTVSALFSQPLLKNTLTTLLDGIGADELVSLAQPLLPEELVLPAAQKGEGAYGYLEGLLRSGDFYGAVTGESTGWSEFRSFGEVPVARAVELVTGETLGSLGLESKLEALAGSLEGELLTGLIRLLGEEGAVEDAKAELLLTFSFDDSRKIMGFTLEGLCTGKIVEAPADGDGAPANGEGRPLRASVKISATKAEAPEFFSLSGCRYYGEDGEPKTIF